MQENRLADGKQFNFWEKEVNYTRELYVSKADPAASDDNDGSKTKPLKTIQAAANIATPGTHIIIGPGVYRETVSPEKGGDGPETEYVPCTFSKLLNDVIYS